jgi:hypothetical protein
MDKHVILILECDLGDYSDYEEESKLSTDPKDWYDSFYQADINLQDLDIVGVRIEEKE